MTKNDKREQAESTLDANLLRVFDELVEDYKEAADKHVGKVWVNYNILADLIRAGWRKVS